jgi:hypothetical protein
MIDVPDPVAKPSNGLPEETLMTVVKGHPLQTMVDQKL